MIGRILCKRPWAMTGATMVVVAGMSLCPLHVSAPMLTVMVMLETWLLFHRKECCQQEQAHGQARAA